MSLTKEQRKEIRLYIGTLLDEECGNCEKKKEANKQKITSRLFQNYCIHECPLGKRLQRLCAYLEGETNIVQEKRGRKTLGKALKIKETLQEISS